MSLSLDRVLWITLLCCLFVFLVMNHLSLHHHSEALPSSKSLSVSRGAPAESINRLIDLVRIQNLTIHALEEKIGQLSDSSTTDHTFVAREISLVKSDSTKVECTSNNDFQSFITKDRETCETKYGMELASIWKKNEEIWCTDDDSKDEESKSQLKCYPYHQAHKKLDGRGPDLICEATNFMIDFSKVCVSLLDFLVS
jgi:hypothetical protein